MKQVIKDKLDEFLGYVSDGTMSERRSYSVDDRQTHHVSYRFPLDSDDCYTPPELKSEPSRDVVFHFRIQTTESGHLRIDHNVNVDCHLVPHKLPQFINHLHWYLKRYGQGMYDVRKMKKILKYITKRNEAIQVNYAKDPIRMRTIDWKLI